MCPIVSVLFSGPSSKSVLFELLPPKFTSDCLLPHGFHPIFGLMLSGTLDQHDAARSDGRHREIFFRRLQKKRKNRPGKGTGVAAVSIRRRGRRGRRNPASPVASSATTFVRRAECPLRVISRRAATAFRMSALRGRADIVALNVCCLLESGR